MQSKTLIIGSSGNVGKELAQILTGDGHAVALATSKKELSADQVHLDLVTGEGITAAFDGVDRAFFLAPPGYTNQHELIAPLVKAAKANDLKKVVLMTAMGVDAQPDLDLPLRRAEIILEESGVPYNIIRPNWFMQNFNSFWIAGILEHQTIFLPTGDAKGSFIDARDIAAVAAKLLLDSSRDNQAFDLTGSESLNHDEVAAIISEITGKKIVYEDITPQVMEKQLISAGLPQDYTNMLLGILEAFKQGFMAGITPHVGNILGRAPISFEQYAKDYRNAWV